MDHYLTEHNYQAIGKWKLEPNDLQITTNSDKNTNPTSIIEMPKIGSFWRHSETGDVVVACDWGIGGLYQLYHIPNEYVEQGTEWLKRLRLQKDEAKYSHGARVLESERHDAEEFISEVEEYLQNNPEGVLDE